MLALARMPFNELKIDKAFVSSAASNAESLKIVTAVASLGRGLGLSVVAEGVETADVAALLCETGCHTGQGWLYGRAVPSAAFQALISPASRCSGNLVS
jgi:EAL domain-containing protein (putative c-di-GMP-specific phosphodiesterase class I)